MIQSLRRLIRRTRHILGALLPRVPRQARLNPAMIDLESLGVPLATDLARDDLSSRAHQLDCNHEVMVVTHAEPSREAQSDVPNSDMMRLAPLPMCHRLTRGWADQCPVQRARGRSSSPCPWC